jgi:hypothetical protein
MEPSAAHDLGNQAASELDVGNGAGLDVQGRNLACALRLPGLVRQQNHEWAQSWVLPASVLLDLLDAIARRKVTVRGIMDKAVMVMTTDIPEGGCCLTCADLAAEYEKARRSWAESVVRQRLPEQYPFVVEGSKIHRAVCSTNPRLRLARPGTCLADFVHGADKPYTVLRNVTAEDFLVSLTSDELRQWCARRMSTTGGRPKYSRCRTCRPQVPAISAREP